MRPGPRPHRRRDNPALLELTICIILLLMRPNNIGAVPDPIVRPRGKPGRLHYRLAEWQRRFYPCMTASQFAYPANPASLPCPFQIIKS